MDKDMRQLRTPCYLLAEDRYRENLRTFRDRFREAWGGACAFGYSVKTNHLRWLLDIAREEGYLAEVVSPDEYDCVRMLGVPDREIIYNGPQKRDTALTALRAGALVNLDSLQECELICRAAREGAPEGLPAPRIGLRVNFDLEARCPGETTCGPEVSRFGLCEENGDLGRAVRLLIPQAITLYISQLQCSSLVSFLSLMDLSKAGQQVAQKTMLPFLIFGIVAGLYFVLSYPLARFAKYLEKRIGFTI